VSDLMLPRVVADELLAELPERIAQRAMAELTAEFVRLCRSDQMAAAATFWSDGIDRIAGEVLAEFRAQLRAWSAPEWRWRTEQ
jgi:hypothetical protein